MLNLQAKLCQKYGHCDCSSLFPWDWLWTRLEDTLCGSVGMLWHHFMGWDATMNQKKGGSQVSTTNHLSLFPDSAYNVTGCHHAFPTTMSCIPTKLRWNKPIFFVTEMKRSNKTCV